MKTKSMLAIAMWLACSAGLTVPARGDVILGTSHADVNLPVWVGGLYAAPGFTADPVNGPTYYPFGDVYFCSFTEPVSAGPGGADFLGAASLLTNGADNRLGLLFEGTWYDLEFESAALSGPSFVSPDFQGATITSMTLVQTYWHSFPPPDYTHIGYDITYYGVPEPGVLALLALGNLIVLRRRPK